MKSGSRCPLRARSALVLALAAAVACEPYPRDPEGTLERASGGVLRVGVTEAPPWLVQGPDGSPAGPEAELIEAFARSIDADVDWRWGGADAHLAALEHYELDLVAAGLTARSPWATHVGLSRPWLTQGDTQRVLAGPPGENATLLALERLIEARRRESTR